MKKVLRAALLAVACWVVIFLSGLGAAVAFEALSLVRWDAIVLRGDYVVGGLVISLCLSFLAYGWVYGQVRLE